MASKTSNIDTVNKSNTPVSIKAKVLQTVTTVNGTLYENEIVRIDRSENNHYRVKDSMGRIWFVDKKNIKIVKEFDTQMRSIHKPNIKVQKKLVFIVD